MNLLLIQGEMFGNVILAGKMEWRQYSFSKNIIHQVLPIFALRVFLTFLYLCPLKQFLYFIN